MEGDHSQSETAISPALVQAACGGDQSAFGELFRMLYPRVHRTLWGMLGTESEAHEVAQETWLKAWNKRDKFNFESQYSTWVHRIAVNSALDALRKRRKLRDRFLSFGLGTRDEGRGTREFADPGPSSLVSGPSSSTGPGEPVREVENRELGERIREEVSNLPDEQRTVLVLREYEGYSYEEIAETLGVKPGTVMSRLYHARKKLQQRLARELS